MYVKKGQSCDIEGGANKGYTNFKMRSKVRDITGDARKYKQASKQTDKQWK